MHSVLTLLDSSQAGPKFFQESAGLAKGGGQHLMQHNPYLTAREVSELLKLNVETVYLLIAKQQLPALRVGGRWRFDESELRQWLKTQRSAT
jgi:excisionase family DNA binding protein